MQELSILTGEYAEPVSDFLKIYTYFTLNNSHLSDLVQCAKSK